MPPRSDCSTPRASARAAREAADTARRSLELAERSRQAAARARLRLRVERVGELVQDIATSSLSRASHRRAFASTRSQCHVLNRAVIGLRDSSRSPPTVPGTHRPADVGDRARAANTEIDGVCKKLTGHRPHSTYRPRHQVPWNRRPGCPISCGGRGTKSPWPHTPAVALTTRVTSTATSRWCDPPPPSTEPRNGDTSQ